MILNKIEISEEELKAQLSSYGYEVVKQPAKKRVWVQMAVDRDSYVCNRPSYEGFIPAAVSNIGYPRPTEKFHIITDRTMPDDLIKAYEALYNSVRIGWDENGDLLDRNGPASNFSRFSKAYGEIKDIKSRMAKK